MILPCQNSWAWIDYLYHFVSADDSIFVDIIEPEAPVNLLLKCSFTQCWQKIHEVPKRNSASIISEIQMNELNFSPTEELYEGVIKADINQIKQ